MAAMINIFDRTLKIIARNHAETFLRLAFPGQEIELLGAVENVEISLSVKPVDLVHRVLHAGEEFIFHLEFQLTHETDLPKRTFITSAELTDLFERPVLTLMLYLRPRQTPPATEYVTRLGNLVVNRFTYPGLQLAEHVEEIRRGDLRELAPLLVMLVMQPDEVLLAEERTLILQEPDQHKRADLLAAAIAIGSRYFRKEFLWQFFREEVEQMKNVSFIEDWIEEGVQQGVQQGEKTGYRKGLEESIIQILLAKFDPLARTMRPVEQQLASIEPIPLLQQLLREAILADTLDDFARKLANVLKQPESASEATNPATSN